MDGLTACSSAAGRFIHPLPAIPSRKNQRNRCFHGRRSSSFLRILACRGGGGPLELDQWDQMELKFGRLLGEDPKLTLAKIMGRKMNPDVSYLDIEKSFRNKKVGIDEGEHMAHDTLGVDLEVGGKPPRSPPRLRALRCTENPVDGSKLNLVRPTMDNKTKAARAVEKPIPSSPRQPNKPAERIVTEDGVPNVALRKPTFIHEDDLEMEKSSKVKIKPNLVLKMRKGPVESLNDVTLLKKPEVVKISLNPPNQERMPSRNSLKEKNAAKDSVLFRTSVLATTSLPLNDNEVKSPHESQYGSDGAVIVGMMDAGNANIGLPSDLLECESEEDDEAEIGLQLPKQTGVAPDVEEAPLASDPSSILNCESTTSRIALHGKPKRQDDPVEEMSHLLESDRTNLSDEDHNIAAVTENFTSAKHEKHEVSDWRRAEDLLRIGERTEVELISCSSSGFVVSFGSLIGFLPYRNLGSKWKFLAFESWLRKKGLDPSLYRQNLSIMGSYEVQKKNLMDSSQNLIDSYNDGDKLAPDMKFEDLLDTYDQDKTKFLSSFIGQIIRVSVVFADQKSRRLMFSGRPKERGELIERKRNLMARLSVGDVVKCCIKKITFFGIFVEVEGVPALIHQSEISWDGALDPSSCFKIGQIVDAKVHQLDYGLDRITLSLKEVMPDPLNEALESVVGDHTSLDGTLEAAQEDAEWADVESLIKELQEVGGVLGAKKGRFFLSPGLAPTFQVYMASMYENQYKLLARYGNKVQEVLVQSSLDKEQMKAAILTCTNRVE